MPKCVENEVYDLNRTSIPSLEVDYVQTVFVEGVEVGVDVYWKDGSVSQMPEYPAPAASDNDVGYHNLTLEDL